MKKYLLCIIIFFISFQHGISSGAFSQYCGLEYNIGVIEDISENTTIVIIKFKYIANCESDPLKIECLPSPQTYSLDLTEDAIYAAFIPILWTAYENKFYLAFKYYEEDKNSPSRRISDIALDNNLNTESFAAKWSPTTKCD